MTRLYTQLEQPVLMEPTNKRAIRHNQAITDAAASDFLQACQVSIYKVLRIYANT